MSLRGTIDRRVGRALRETHRPRSKHDGIASLNPAYAPGINQEGVGRDFLEAPGPVVLVEKR